MELKRAAAMPAASPQIVPDVIRVSPLADAAGWVDVDPATLRHRTLPGVSGLGDACIAPNAKTAAARKPAPVVAHDRLKDRGAIQGADPVRDGYGSWMLRGKEWMAKPQMAG